MNNRSLNVTVIVCATALMIASLIANAGPLSPPAGPIAPTNKTLAEVEPRIAISATNTPGDADSLFRIAAPGSYYLTSNIAGVAAKRGIEIASSGVTLDLMGFDLLGVAGSLDGVSVSVMAVNIHIHNGSVRNWGAVGVDASPAFNSSLRDLRAEGNDAGGLRLGEGGLVEACVARSNGGNGIIAGAGSTVSGNTVRFNTGDGIFADAGSTVSGNTASGSTGDGIQVTFDCLVLNNNCDSNGFGVGDGSGIHSTGSDNRIDGNNVTDNDRGIDVDASGNLIIRNSASGNTVDYSIFFSGQTIGPTILPGTITSTNPWANFSY